MERVTKKESSLARQFANNLFECLHKEMKEKYRFETKLVGSAIWNTILKEKGKPWDLDYQILLTNNSKDYKKNGFNNPTKIKEDFFNWFNNHFKNKKGYIVQNSTTAITVINKNSNYSYDFVIIKDRNQIIRRNNNDHTGRNLYTWNKLRKYNDAFLMFDSFSPNEKKIVIEKYILPRKIKEKAKSENDPTKRSSCEAFIEEVNNYAIRKRNY